jgi:OOP family OmpA-OmpF porin
VPTISTSTRRFCARPARERIFTEGKGETQPETSNATRAGRAQNRRVEVEMVGTRSR